MNNAHSNVSYPSVLREIVQSLNLEPISVSSHIANGHVLDTPLVSYVVLYGRHKR
jgi:hypothetical protein